MTHLPVTQWQKYYEDERALLRSVFGKLSADSTNTEGLKSSVDVEEELRKFAQKGEEEKKAQVNATLKALGITDWKSLVTAGQRIADEMKRESLQDLREMVMPKDPVPRDFRDRLGTPEVLFFFGVWFPCWIEYGVKLPVLVSQAKAGDLKALCKLLRLDKAALEVPEIRQQYHARIGDKGAFGALNRALAGKPYRKLTRQKVKMTLAAYIYKAFAQWDEKLRELEERFPAVRQPVVKLTPAEVHGLFDSAARYEHDAMRDNDLPLNPHAFYVALKRELAFWPDFA